jgi:hypothetical protein
MVFKTRRLGLTQNHCPVSGEACDRQGDLGFASSGERREFTRTKTLPIHEETRKLSQPIKRMRDLEARASSE